MARHTGGGWVVGGVEWPPVNALRDVIVSNDPSDQDMGARQRWTSNGAAHGRRVGGVEWSPVNALRRFHRL